MQAALLASASYLDELRDDLPLPALEPALKSVCRQAYRRVDRFIQLALLGSARCVQDQPLAPDCGVYLGSSLGPLASNMRVQEQMLRERELPKPFHFVNTLGNIAGFYVTDNLQLDGPSVFVSRGSQCLQALLATALTDLAVGAVEQVLVGVVEEAPLPLTEQRRRLQLQGRAAVAEGSHWLLLAPCGQGEDSPKLTLSQYAAARELPSCLGAERAASQSVCLSRGLAPAAAREVRRCCDNVVGCENLPLPRHASVEAAWFVGASLDAGVGPWPTLIGGDDSGGGYLLDLRP